MDSAQSDVLSSPPATGSSAVPRLSVPNDEAQNVPASTGTVPVPASSGNARYYRPPEAQATLGSPQIPPVPVSVPTSGVSTTIPSAPGEQGLRSQMSTPSPSLSPVPPRETADIPTVSAEASANQVQERMRAANAAMGSGKKKPVILALVAIILLGAIAAGVFWWWSNREVVPNTVNLDQTLTQEEVPPNDELPPTVTEGVVERDESLTAVTATEVLPEDAENTATVYGIACKYEEIYPGGAVLFYHPETQDIYRSSIPAGQNVYSITVPAGEYMAFFEPKTANLPIFAFTEYVNCGLDPNTCTDHSLAVFSVEAGQEYGQVDLCDPQYPQEGLPTELQYENS